MHKSVCQYDQNPRVYWNFYELKYLDVRCRLYVDYHKVMDGFQIVMTL